MRVRRFEEYLKNVLVPDGVIQSVATAAETGWTIRPAGVAVKTTTETIAVNVYRSAYNGDDRRDQEKILYGSPLGAKDFSTPTGSDPACHVGHTLHTRLHAGHPEISRAERMPYIPLWIAYGIMTHFYSGAYMEIHVGHLQPWDRPWSDDELQ